MNKTKNFIALILVVAIFGAMLACQKPAAINTNENKAAANTNQAANAATPEPTNTTTTSSAGTPTDAYKAAYTARKNKDIEGLKKLMSKDVIEFLTMVAEADEKKKSTLDDQLKELCEKPQAATAEARNEKIDGDYATIEYLDEKGGWKPMEFIKEDGVWKLAFGPKKPGSPDKANDNKK
ncbi:MAG: hypothetical protein ABL952_16080 [Pyrinomonadaceae bacterium]